MKLKSRIAIAAIAILPLTSAAGDGGLFGPVKAGAGGLPKGSIAEDNYLHEDWVKLKAPAIGARVQCSASMLDLDPTGPNGELAGLTCPGLGKTVYKHLVDAGWSPINVIRIPHEQLGTWYSRFDVVMEKRQ
jgi:hypothetical protein